MKEFSLDDTTPLSEYFNSGFETHTAEHKREVQRFRYERPALKSGKSRAAVRLVMTDLLVAILQVFEKGGETVKHSHAGMDGFWLVLKGRAVFYIEEDDPVALRPMEGLCIPRGVKYWFEKEGDEALEILQVDALHPGLKNTITRFSDPIAEKDGGRAALAMFDALKEE